MKRLVAGLSIQSEDTTVTEEKSWLDLIKPESIQESELIPPDNETTFPELAKLSMKRRREILDTPLPARSEADFIPVARLIKDTAADLMRDGIKVGEAQLKPRTSHYADIKAAMLAYKAKHNQLG
jgi:hypothetical protein